jgi:hypothetical protein
MYKIPRATVEDQPEPFWFSTLTGITVASGAVPLIGAELPGAVPSWS